ncbi:endolytic transglycosylase MltG [Desulfocurvibacter africanus]|uniref:endolytic transglycosylase MltG n=1 Tax=Desulfocurvibacter africanus TaxID=873 RepID=UPI002FD9CF3C
MIKRMLKLLVGLVAVGLVIGLVAGGWLGWQAWKFLNTPSETPGREVVLDIQPGETFAHVAVELERKGVITDAEKFRLLGRWRKATGHVRAGEFALNTGMVPDEVLKTLTTGTEMLHRLVVREGLAWWETAKLVEQAGLGSFESFKAAVHDPELLAKHNIQADSAEGYLFPETYMLPKPKGNDARAVVEVMLGHFATAAGKVWPQGLPEPRKLHELVVLASLVEKETGAPAERPRIAGVYANRIERGMRLQCDPTIIYGLGESFDGNIRKAHLLDADNPYNTYRINGLPPGPIASPGLESLKAAAEPEKHAYLYFVSRQDGTHQFSKTLEEHNAAVREYQLRRH